MKTTSELEKGTKSSMAFQNGRWEGHPLSKLLGSGVSWSWGRVCGSLGEGRRVAGRRYTRKPSEGSGLRWGILSEGNLVVFSPERQRLGLWKMWSELMWREHLD